MGIDRLAFYKASWAGVLRIGLWFVFFLYLFGKLVPTLPEEVPLQKSVHDAPIIPMLTMMEDSRSVREDYKPDPKKINVAWLSDSSGVMMDQGKGFESTPEEKYRLVSATIAQRLQKDYGLKNLEMPLYLRLSSRSVDMLAFSLLAAKNKPDIIVIPVNSIWSFSHYQVANRDRAMPLAATVFGPHARLWPMLLSLCPPVNYLWSLAGVHFDIIERAYPFKKHLLNSYGRLLSVDAGKQVGKFDASEHVSNIPFWVIMNILDGHIELIQNKAKLVSPLLMYHQVIRHNDSFKTSSWGGDAFRLMVDLLKESGIPVLIYNWPLPDTLRGEPLTLEKINEETAFLKKENVRLKGTNIKIISEVPEDIRKTMTFRKFDDYHLSAEGKLDDFLAREIWLMLKEHSPKVKDKKQ